MTVAFTQVHQALRRGDGDFGPIFGARDGAVYLLVTSFGGRVRYSELPDLLHGLGMKLSRDGLEKTDCDYRREDDPHNWLGAISLEGPNG